MLIDSHAHLDVDEFSQDLNEVIDRARQEGVTGIITVGVDLNSSIKAVEIANKYEGIYAGVGFHPHNAKKIKEDHIKELISLASDKKVVALGEIGLDFFKNYSPAEIQKEIFLEQLQIAAELGLPVIIHDRDAHEEVLSILEEMAKKYKLQGVIHCFSGDVELAKKFIQIGFYISIPGTVTYKKASKIRRVVSEISLEHMLIETDSPFLTPYQKRGQRNEPAFVKFVAQEISLIKGVSFESVAEKTSANTKKLFKAISTS